MIPLIFTTDASQFHSDSRPLPLLFAQNSLNKGFRLKKATFLRLPNTTCSYELQHIVVVRAEITDFQQSILVSLPCVPADSSALPIPEQHPARSLLCYDIEQPKPMSAIQRHPLLYLENQCRERKGLGDRRKARITRDPQLLCLQDGLEPRISIRCSNKAVEILDE